MRIGIYGGSFNPVHNGHIHLARAAAEEFGLEKVYLVPSRISPHRSSAEYVSGGDRLEMLRLACNGDAILEVSSYELDSDRVSYTIYTIKYFRSIFPDAELFLLVGSDMLMCFDKWRQYKDILALCSLGVVSRNEGDIPLLEEKARSLSEYGRIFVCKADAVVVSSTKIRENCVKNSDFACYLDENVVEYIMTNSLYTAQSDRSADE